MSIPELDKESEKSSLKKRVVNVHTVTNRNVPAVDKNSPIIVAVTDNQ